MDLPTTFITMWTKQKLTGSGLVKYLQKKFTASASFLKKMGVGARMLPLDYAAHGSNPDLDLYCLVWEQY